MPTFLTYYRKDHMSVVNKLLVLKLNKHWQVIGQGLVCDSVIDLAAGINSYALDIDYVKDENGNPDFSQTTMVRPVSWDEWITLPIRSWDFTIKTVKMNIRVPTVLISKNYEGMPMVRFGKSPSTEQVRIRDGNIDQYTGKVLSREDMSIDHVIPKSKGGDNTWENVVLTHKDINRRKGNRLNSEIGLKTIRKPSAPSPIPRYKLIREARHQDWSLFIK